MIPDLPGWDSLPAVTRYHNWAEIAGIIAVAVLVVAEIIQFKYGHRRDDLIAQEQTATNQRHDEEMARLHLDTAQSNARAAEATQKATEAQLALEKFKAPRVLQPEQWAAIAAAMRQFGNIQFDVAVGPMGDPEPEIFGRTLADTLSNGGWTQIDWDTNDPQIRLERTGSRFVGFAAVTNVIIDIHPAEAGRLWPAAQALAAALKAQGVDADAQQGSGGRNKNNTAIHVMIGRKM